MVEGRQRDAWDRASNIMAIVANTARDKKTRPRPFTAKDFNPFTQRHRRAKADVSLLKKIFVDRDRGREVRTEAGQHKGANRGKQQTRE